MEHRALAPIPSVDGNALSGVLFIDERAVLDLFELKQC